MPRYRFNLVDDRTVADQRGQRLENGELTQRVADGLAEDLHESRPEPREVQVTNSEGEEFGLAPLDANGSDA